MPTQELLSHRFDFCAKKIFVLKKFNSIQTCVNSLLTIHKHYLRISKLFNFSTVNLYEECLKFWKSVSERSIKIIRRWCF